MGSFALKKRDPPEDSSVAIQLILATSTIATIAMNHVPLTQNLLLEGKHGQCFFVSSQEPEGSENLTNHI
jgi:hypothetical protein